MDDSKFSVRSFADSDFEAFASIQKSVRPDVPVSAESFRHFDSLHEAGLVHRRYVVELRSTGHVVAIGELEESPFEARLGKYWVHALVRPEFQRQGIGSRLYETLLSDAKGLNGNSLRAAVREQETAGVRFLTQRGFKERRRSWQSLLDLDVADTTRLPSLLQKLAATGVEVTTLTREGIEDPEVVQKLHRLDAETSNDAPRLEPYVPLTIDQYRRFQVKGPNTLPDGWFIAKVRDRYVAMSYVEREAADPDTLEQAYTCTDREYRRRGLALALKFCVIDYGQRNHFRRIRTNNDSLNAPMWTLNERLGFRRLVTWIQTEKELSPAASRDASRSVHPASSGG